MTSNQITLRIQDKGNTVTYSSHDSFSFQSVSSLSNKNKKPIQKKVKTIIQKNPLLNETDLHEDGDTVSNRNSQPCLTQTQTSHSINNLAHEV